jgi:hypothetical protein
MRVERISILFILLMILFFGFQCGKNRTAPDHLIGVWKTSEPKYEDRFFEIDRSTITFGIGEGNIDTHSITNIEIEKVAEAKGNLYTIYYKNKEGEESKFSFYYNPTDHGVIRFKNQDQIVWTREKK